MSFIQQAVRKSFSQFWETISPQMLQCILGAHSCMRLLYPRRKYEVETAKVSECAICLGQEDMVKINGCSHEFCFTCIDKWSETKLECPMCRAVFTHIETTDGIFECPEVEYDE